VKSTKARLSAVAGRKAIPVSDQVLEVATPADVQKLQADLDEANGKVESLTADNAKLQADLDEAQKQID
jgi:hypothetical protein